MTKYIDADLLIRKIRCQIRRENLNFAALGGGGQTVCINTLEWVLKQIASLQQEDIPETTLCATCPNRRNTHAYQDGYDAGRADALKELNQQTK